MSLRDRAPTHRAYPWSHMDPDRRNTVLLVSGIAVVVVFALALIGYGYYNDKIAPNHEIVLRTGNESFDFSFLKRRVTAGVRDNSVDLSKDTAVPSVLSDVEREAVLRQTAIKEGLQITDAEVMSQIATMLQMDPATKRNDIAPALRARLLKTGLSLSEFEDMARAAVAENEIKDDINKNIPAETEQVFVRQIVTSTQSKAIEAHDRVAGGEGFIQVVAALTEDDDSKKTGGDLGFVPRGALPPEVEKVAFNSMGLSDVIETKDAFYVIEVEAKEVQPVDDAAKDRVVKTTLATRLNDTRTAVGTHPALTTGQVRRILQTLPAPPPAPPSA